MAMENTLFEQEMQKYIFISWWMFHCHIHFQARCFTPHLPGEMDPIWRTIFLNGLVQPPTRYSMYTKICTLKHVLFRFEEQTCISLYCHFLNRRKESIWIPWKDLRKLRTGPAIATFPEASFQKETVVAHALFGFLARTYCGCPRRESVFQLVWIESSECQAGSFLKVADEVSRMWWRHTFHLSKELQL